MATKIHYEIMLFRGSYITQTLHVCHIYAYIDPLKPPLAVSRQSGSPMCRIWVIELNSTPSAATVAPPPATSPRPQVGVPDEVGTG